MSHPISPEQAADLAAERVSIAFERVSPWSIGGKNSPLAALDALQPQDTAGDMIDLLDGACATLGSLAIELGFHMVADPAYIERLPRKPLGNHRKLAYSGPLGIMRRAISFASGGDFRSPQYTYIDRDRRNLIQAPQHASRWTSSNTSSMGTVPPVELLLNPGSQNLFNWWVNDTAIGATRDYGFAMTSTIFRHMTIVNTTNSQSAEFTAEDARQKLLTSYEGALQAKPIDIFNSEVARTASPEELEVAIDDLVEISRKTATIDMIKRRAKVNGSDFFGIQLLPDGLEILNLFSKVAFAGIAAEKDTFDRKRFVPTRNSLATIRKNDNGIFLVENTRDVSVGGYIQPPTKFSDALRTQLWSSVEAAGAVYKLFGSEDPAGIPSATVNHIIHEYGLRKALKRINTDGVKLSRKEEDELRAELPIFQLVCDIAKGVEPKLGRIDNIDLLGLHSDLYCIKRANASEYKKADTKPVRTYDEIMASRS